MSLPTADDTGAPHAPDGFCFRDARPADRAQVVEFTAHTWGENGDYIARIYDDWLADPGGRFIAIEEQGTGRVAGIDKLTMLSPQEAWFEGLRVNPDFRGRGLATHSQRYMIGEARRLGARTVRLLTLLSNTPVHIICYRHGFRLRLVVRYWSWQPGQAAEEVEEINPAIEPLPLRAATEGEAPALFDWWRKGAAYRTADLAYDSWQYASTSSAEWAQAASARRLFVPLDLRLDSEKTPPPTVLIAAGKYPSDVPQWEVSALAGAPAMLAPLLAGLQRKAKQAGVSQISGLFPEAVEVQQALEAARFQADGDDERLTLFELSLG